MNKLNESKKDLLKLLADLTKIAVIQTKENGVDSEMLNAIRENIKFLIKCSKENF